MKFTVGFGGDRLGTAQHVPSLARRFQNWLDGSLHSQASFFFIIAPVHFDGPLACEVLILPKGRPSPPPRHFARFFFAKNV
mgnify:CR=1 FL=1